MGRTGEDGGADVDGGGQMSTVLDAQGVRQWISLAAELVTAHERELTELDAAIGDADHGANMRRGFQAAAQAVQDPALATPGAVLKKVAMTLISTIGGASGPLYGTFFLRMAGECGDSPEIDLPVLLRAMEAGVAGVQARGRSQAGEKTMLDAWLPALEAMRGQSDLAAGTAAAARAAQEGRGATAAMRATKGRASYLGQRSVGHIDPGAASTALVLQALAQAETATSQEEQA
ncbi:dihydroxyacetone kinase, L subunit [Actinomyces urogenitalis DSM 15434]|uniref:Dihydroxyacetone kinase, L subunit n=4 Tax=root TaxID=1 RepID=C0W3K3_9ACTO|nr:dihydroxyacetone kinase, L subunit [Actinomyces urogenitalis DSM 15434]ETJ02070.1 MAG: Dihydroxyacetone kinase [Actinomyces urogenitalis DORA_12]KGF03779.1 dihydroxyacetone kinase [Actinomyces urogenitalis S6-C4]